MQSAFRLDSVGVVCSFRPLIGDRRINLHGHVAYVPYLPTKQTKQTLCVKLVLKRSPTLRRARNEARERERLIRRFGALLPKWLVAMYREEVKQACCSS